MHGDASFDDCVADMDDATFTLAAEHVALAMVRGTGLTMFFQPGDATRYKVGVTCRQTITVSSPNNNDGPDVQHGQVGLGSVLISFGVERKMQTCAWGHIEQLRPDHPWSAAVWRRLLAEIRNKLET